MLGKIQILNDNQGRTLKDPTVVKNVDAYFDTFDENFKNVRVVIFNKDNDRICRMIVIREEMYDDNSFIFQGLSFDAPAFIGRDDPDPNPRKEYHIQSVIFIPY